MHFYTSTEAKRHKPTAVIAFVCFVGSLLLSGLIARAGLPSEVGAPSALALFGAGFAAFDRWIWKWSVLGLSVSSIPNLNGSWKGEIEVCKWALPDDSNSESRVKEYLGKHDCDVEIEQTWTRIQIRFTTEATESDSLMASVGPAKEGGGGLRYEYAVKGRPGANLLPGEETRQHRGMAYLLPARSRDWSKLRGGYFNDQEFQLFGAYSLDRQ